MIALGVALAGLGLLVIFSDSSDEGANETVGRTFLGFGFALAGIAIVVCNV